jgi:SAM-dependent methyltransferase
MHHGAMTSTAQEFWEDFYEERDQIWSGSPNKMLVREVASLTPGTALDVGCGEGADAIWLATQGWQVTAVDVSDVALRRGAAHALEAGVSERIVWARHDLSESFPTGLFDLVSAQFLHSPVAPADERDKILRRAADAVAPGGTLLIVGHAGWPSWVDDPPFDHRFPTTQEVLASLNLPQDGWQTELEEVVQQEMTSPDGEPGWRVDNALRVRRIR